MSHRAGVVTAFVHKVDARQGRVLVEYRSMEDNLQSTWAPVAAPLSGSRRGQLFMPEVGDECLVAFQDGAFDHPFVVGFLWNGEQVSSEHDAFNRVIVTPGGHQLRFEDKENDTRIILRSKGNHELTFEDKASGPLVRLKSNGGRELLFDDTPGGAKVKIDAGSGVATIQLNVTPPSIAVSVAGNTINIDGTALAITAPGNVTVNAGGAASITVGGAASVTIGGAASITAAGAATITAGGAATITAATTTVTTAALTVNAAISTFSGIVVASTVVTTAVVSPVYTPGLFNLL